MTASPPSELAVLWRSVAVPGVDFLHLNPCMFLVAIFLYRFCWPNMNPILPSSNRKEKLHQELTILYIYYMFLDSYLLYVLRFLTTLWAGFYFMRRLDNQTQPKPKNTPCSLIPSPQPEWRIPEHKPYWPAIGWDFHQNTLQSEQWWIRLKR